MQISALQMAAVFLGKTAEETEGNNKVSSLLFAANLQECGQNNKALLGLS